MSRENCCICGVFKDIALYQTCTRDAELYGIDTINLKDVTHWWVPYIPPIRMLLDLAKRLDENKEDFRGASGWEEDQWA